MEEYGIERQGLDFAGDPSDYGRTGGVKDPDAPEDLSPKGRAINQFKGTLSNMRFENIFKKSDLDRIIKYEMSEFVYNVDIEILNIDLLADAFMFYKFYPGKSIIVPNDFKNYLPKMGKRYENYSLDLIRYIRFLKELFYK